MAPATTASRPSLTTTALAAPVCAAEDEEATDDDPVWLALLDFAELLEDCLAELLEPEPEEEALPLLLAPEVAALAAKDPLLDAALPLDETAAVACAALPVMAPGPSLPVAV